MTCGVRVIHGTWNVGVENNIPLDPWPRVLHVGNNVGIEALSVVKRVIHASWNVGAEFNSVLARVIHAVWRIGWGTAPTDPPEWKLIDANLIDVLYILRPK